MTDLPLLQVLQVSRRFALDRTPASPAGGDFAAVDNVSLDIRAGEFLSLLGPSGCGKTTLLRMLAGFEVPDSGQILIDGVNVTHVPPNRRPVNLVFQHYALFPHLSVEKNVAFGLRYQKSHGDQARQRVAEALDRVQLKDFAGRKPNQLSGGQKQRVALARALVLNPRVLLLDEPLAALDQKLRREMQIELKHLQRTVGITFVFVTHDQEEALVMSDRVGVMNAGRLEQLGSPADVFERPRTEFVARFMGAANFFAFDGRRCVVRPEKLRLLPTDAAIAPTMRSRPVTCVERLYQGLSTVWTVRDSFGGTFNVYQQNTDDQPQGTVGAPALLCWDTANEVPLE